MKEYIFVRDDEQVRVETDAFGSIDNFMVTGIFGSCPKLVCDGFSLSVGQFTTKKKMTNLAVTLGCSLSVYDGGNLITEESGDYRVSTISETEEE